MQRAGGGQDGPVATPSFKFKAELTNLFADQISVAEKVAPNGIIEGRVQWIQYGHELSRFKEGGELKDEFKEKLNQKI